MTTVSTIGRVKALWRQGWTEIPEIMAATGYALIGMVVGFSALYNRITTHGLNQKYTKRPIIMRPDDPRVPKIQRYSELDS